jgi:predicted aspartyl protease
MTTPKDRVSFGHHTFPFFGLQIPGGAELPLPLLPLRIRPVGGQFGRPFNAILDTGSTRTLIPSALARANAIRTVDETSQVRVIGGTASGHDAALDLAIVDAHFPEITCWEVANTQAKVMSDEDLDCAVLGWDTLRLFEFTIDRKRERVSLRLQPL